MLNITTKLDYKNEQSNSIEAPLQDVEWSFPGIFSIAPETHCKQGNIVNFLLFQFQLLTNIKLMPILYKQTSP